MAFCNPCVRPTNSSLINYTQRPTSSLKSLLRRQLFKKSSTTTSSCAPIRRSTQNHSHSTARFQRIKGTNFVREINPVECSFASNSTNNYDMTVFHDDQLDESEINYSRRQTKKIPRWARKSQLQLAIVNQLYFNDKQPEEIFGTFRMDSVRELIQSIPSQPQEFAVISYSKLPANFV